MWALRSVLFRFLLAWAIAAAFAFAFEAPSFLLPLSPLDRFVPSSEPSRAARAASWICCSDMCEYQTSRVRIPANSAIPDR